MKSDINLSNILNLANLFIPSTTKKENSNDNWEMSALDASIHTESLRVCKSVIPYLSYENQKSLSIIIKAVELVSVINHFSDDSLDNEQPLTNYRSDNNWQEDLLNDVKGSLEPENAFWIDIMFKLKEAQEILNNKDEVTIESEVEAIDKATSKQLNDQDDFAKEIAPQLTDKQNQLLKTLSKVMK